MRPTTSAYRRWWMRARAWLRRASDHGIRTARRVKRIARARLSRPRGDAHTQVKPLPLRIRPGQYFPAGSARRLPIVVIVAPGLDAGEAEDLVREVELAQMMTASFRPLFVIDSADFSPFRQRGYVVERVMRAEELAARNPGDSYPEYLYSRLAMITRSYRATSVVPVPAGSLDALRGPLLRLIGAIPAKVYVEAEPDRVVAKTRRVS